MRARWLACVLLATGCVSTSQVGPYVRSVYRQGPWLTVQKCMIVLVGETLEESNCTIEHLPLASVPVAPPVAPAAPAPVATR